VEVWQNKLMKIDDVLLISNLEMHNVHNFTRMKHLHIYVCLVLTQTVRTLKCYVQSFLQIFVLRDAVLLSIYCIYI